MWRSIRAVQGIDAAGGLYLRFVQVWPRLRCLDIGRRGFNTRHPPDADNLLY
jgi:hypothetical protein